MTAHGSSPISVPERALRIAVVGAGPAGFYTAEALLKYESKYPALSVDIDLFERLPAPYGLVRYGVAPDHQKIKSVTVAYDKVCESPHVRFLGNVHVAEGDLSVEELLAHYDQVVLAVGCASDRRLGIAGEDLEGSHPATRFVAWYNGHPDHRNYAVDLSADRAVVVGVGDVSMDLSRMLLEDPTRLATTDVADHAISAFRESRVREVVVLGRRGPSQAAFATKELEDLAALPDVDLVIDRAQVHAELESGHGLDGLLRRKLEYLSHLSERAPSGAAKRLVFRFFSSPVEILGDNGRVSGVRIERNANVLDAEGRPSARGTGETEVLPAGLVLRAVGYKGVPLAGVPFDEKRGIIPNDQGRVLCGGKPWPGVFVAGWIKRGPSGVIGTNKGDANATVHAMLSDATGTVAPKGAPRSRESVDRLLGDRGVRVVSWNDWKRLDQIERARGLASGKVREKLTTVNDLLAALEAHR
jgi:ferredoxin/flavodoxin---NADP+ reductase